MGDASVGARFELASSSSGISSISTWRRTRSSLQSSGRASRPHMSKAYRNGTAMSGARTLWDRSSAVHAHDEGDRALAILIHLADGGVHRIEALAVRRLR